ncbi:MAG: plasmid mobilization relaxosome protein MobC [Christensenellaceae bacterium]|nr:plasmid mobilization relaxosome protein MobC [Christensenellaceae bacterium]MBS6578895.1 plasmid mobilization relaxosome protein MobC [Clostridiales bacterium]PWM01383.1 MAG: mobilization protein [Selenomonadales bacterium]
MRQLEVYDMNQSEFIREAISGATIRPVVVASVINDELLSAIGKLTAEYARIGNNLNQIARHLNEWRSPYPSMAKELKDAATELATLKFEVMKKVGDAIGDIQAYQL